MWRIYGNARLVMVWLGDLSDDADIALAFPRLWKDDQFALEDDDPLHWIYPDVRAFWNAMDAMMWKALVRLLNRPYFRRSWILQELSPARKTFVTCGGKVTVPWEQFENAVRCLRDSPKLRAKLFNASQISDRYQIEQVHCSKHKMLSSRIEISIGEPSPGIIGGAEATALEAGDDPSVHESNRIERKIVRVPKAGDDQFEIVTDSVSILLTWRPWLADRSDSCDFCQTQHGKEAMRPDQMSFYVNVLLTLHSKIGGFGSADLESFASISRCILTGGWVPADDWVNPLKVFRRSKAPDNVIEDKLRVRGQ